MLFVANVDEGSDEVPAAIAEHAAAAGARAVAVSARIESELAELDAEEAAAMRDELGRRPSRACERVVRGAFALLDLIAFFTAGEDKPAQSWHLRRGLTAWHAAGADPLRHAARVRPRRGRSAGTSWSTPAATPRRASAGTLRVEGRDYVVADGDVVHVRFTP